MPDIFDELKKDHARHRRMLKQIAATSGDSEERQEAFAAFKQEVTAHATAEEQSLYSRMLECPELTEQGRHSVAEHKAIDDFIEDLDDTDMSSPGWMATFKKLRHCYEHHIDEEEKEIFPAADKVFSQAKNEKLGKVFDQRKAAELQQQ